MIQSESDLKEQQSDSGAQEKFIEAKAADEADLRETIEAAFATSDRRETAASLPTGTERVKLPSGETHLGAKDSIGHQLAAAMSGHHELEQRRGSVDQLINTELQYLKGREDDLTVILNSGVVQRSADIRANLVNASERLYEFDMVKREAAKFAATHPRLMEDSVRLKVAALLKPNGGAKDLADAYDKATRAPAKPKKRLSEAEYEKDLRADIGAQYKRGRA